MAVCKLHEMPDSVAKEADVVLMSHRDPFYSICSRKMDSMWCKSDPFYEGRYINGKDPLYNQAKEACLKGDEKIEVKTQCQLLMGLQADVYARREEFNKTVAHDVPLEGWNENAHKQIKKVGRAIGICEKAITNLPLVDFIYQMGLYLGGKDTHSKNQKLTNMHAVHSDKERSQKCSNVLKGIEKSAECETWVRKNGSSTGNTILSFLRKCSQSKRDCGIHCLKGHWYDTPQPGGYSRDYKLVKGVAKCTF